MNRRYVLARFLFAVVSLSFVLSGIPGLTGSTVWAQEAESEKDRARKVLKLIRQGKKASKAGNHEEALEHFQKAYELYQRPAILVRLGETAAQLDRTREAIRYYEKFLNEVPEDKKSIISKIEARIERLRQSRRATLEITTKPDDAAIYLGSREGEPAGRGSISTTLPPGDQTVIAVKEGYESRTRALTLEPGSETSIEFTLTRSPESTGDKASSSSSSKPKALHQVSDNNWDDHKSLRIWGWSTAAVGVAGLGTGIAFSMLKSQATSDYNNYDPDQFDVSRRQLRARALSHHRTELIAYGTGGFLTAVGTGLLTYSLVANEPDSRSDLQLRPRGGVRETGAWAGIRLEF